ncbi:MAG TPA: methyltransferase domain-containing protein [Paraburkholderia sp.]|jgi:SAM-dependent methyltransferase|nr:methyltransferase domain-containing protein [Paraburkholderia sp.]
MVQLSYDRQTLNAVNPLARYAHRHRLRTSIKLASQKYRSGLILDYGCGSGAFVAEMCKRLPGVAVGYEPYMTEVNSNDIRIYRSQADLLRGGPYGMVTLFETIEHLTMDELVEFLTICRQILSPSADQSGGILISGPIEVGPALVLKEFNRSVMRLRKPEHGLLEFLNASVLGVAAHRAPDIKCSHKGFDFRVAIQTLRDLGWHVDVLAYGPLPTNTWYGNSQFYLWAS